MSAVAKEGANLLCARKSIGFLRQDKQSTPIYMKSNLTSLR